MLGSVWTSVAQAQYLLQPTHTLDVSGSAAFSTGAWTPAAPTAGGAGTVLHLDLVTSGTSSPVTLTNDFVANPYPLSGLLLDGNAASSLPTTVVGGTLNFLADGATDPRLEVFNTGSWTISSALQLTDPTTLYLPTRINRLELAGGISGPGDLVFDGNNNGDFLSSSGSHRIESVALHTGRTIVRGNTVRIDTSGRLSSTSELRIEPGGAATLGLSGGGSPVDLIDDAVPVTLAGGLLSSASGSAGEIETLGDVTLEANTASRVSLRNGDGGFVFNQLTRQRHATLGVYGSPDIEGVGRAVETLDVGTTLPTVGGGGAPGTTTISIVPYMVGHSQQFGEFSTATPDSLVAYDSATDELRVLDFNEFQLNVVDGQDAPVNVFQSARRELTADTSINALVIDGGAAAITGDATLTVVSGVVMSGNDSTFNALSVRDVAVPREAFFWAIRPFSVFSDVAVVDDLTIAGFDRLELFGDVDVNGGTAVTQGQTHVYGLLDTEDHLIVSPFASLELMPGGTIQTPVLDLSAEDASFRMTGGTLVAASVLGDLVIEGGTFSPGSSPAVTPLSDDYTQLGGATLAVELAGAGLGQFDQLVVAGDATIDGTLDVSLLSGFVPTAGDVFTVLDAAGGVAGRFDSIVRPTLPGVAQLFVDYQPNEVRVVTALPGDFDFDGDVDLDDFNLLASNFGATTGALFADGDADLDGDVDLDDFNILAANFGLIAETPATLPEPASATLILSGSLLAARRHFADPWYE